jgi:hypothetical protein
MDNLYIAANGAAPTTAALVAVTTGTAIKTMLQVATASTRDCGSSSGGSASTGRRPASNAN